jgi:hypothetical protein
MVGVFLAYGADVCACTCASLVEAAAAGLVETVCVLLQAVQQVLSAQHNVLQTMQRVMSAQHNILQAGRRVLRCS